MTHFYNQWHQLYTWICITPGHTSDRVLHFWNSPPVIMGIYKGQTPKDITDQVFGPLKSTTGTVHDFTPYHVFTMFYRQCQSCVQYKSLYKNLSTSCGRSNSTIHLFNPDSLINYSVLLQRFNPHNTFYSTVLYLKLMFTKSPQRGYYISMV